MKIKATLKAFTLIELLVVITIIGILATGATTVYTSQIQKARDTTRLNDIKALQAGIEQTYQDSGTYPNAGVAVANYTEGFSGVTLYTPKLPKDPKTGQKATSSNFDYAYGVAADNNGIAFQIYELSATFENVGNVTTKAVGDGGLDDNRLEIGIKIDSLVTIFNLETPPNTWVASGTPVSGSCLAISGTATANCPTSHSTTTVNDGILVIR